MNEQAEKRAIAQALFEYVDAGAAVTIYRDGHRISTDVGVSIVDTTEGRVLVAPSKAFDGEWVSSFTPATPLAIASAVERLTAALPDGPWFPDLSLTRDFDDRTENRCPTTL